MLRFFRRGLERARSAAGRVVTLVLSFGFLRDRRFEAARAEARARRWASAAVSPRRLAALKALLNAIVNRVLLPVERNFL